MTMILKPSLRPRQLRWSLNMKAHQEQAWENHWAISPTVVHGSFPCWAGGSVGNAPTVGAVCQRLALSLFVLHGETLRAPYGSNNYNFCYLTLTWGSLIISTLMQSQSCKPWDGLKHSQTVFNFSEAKICFGLIKNKKNCRGWISAFKMLYWLNLILSPMFSRKWKYTGTHKQSCVFIFLTVLYETNGMCYN